MVGVLVGVAEGDTVGVAGVGRPSPSVYRTGVAVGVFVGVVDGVAVGVIVGVTVKVGVSVAVVVGVMVAVSVGVRVGVLVCARARSATESARRATKMVVSGVKRRTLTAVSFTKAVSRFFFGFTGWRPARAPVGDRPR